MENKKLDTIYNFGKEVIVEARDMTIESQLKVINRTTRPPFRVALYKKMLALDFSEEQKSLVTTMLIDAIDGAINNFIWMMECNNNKFAFVAKEEDGSCFDIEQESDGLCVRQWEFIDRYSKYNTAEDMLKTGEIEKKPEEK